MRRIGVLFVFALAFAPAAHAAPPTVAATAVPATGAAPLQVTLTATGDAVAYHWDFGDGTAADGAVVQHTYAAGRFTARVTGTSATGETAQATVVVTATGLTLAAPGRGGYQQLARFHGRLTPAAKGARIELYRDNRRIAIVRTSKNGSFVARGRVGTPAARYTARYAGAVSNQVTLVVRPGLDTAFAGSGRIGTPLSLLVRERPATAGTVTVRVWRAGKLVASRVFHGRLRLGLGTRVPGEYRVQVALVPAPGYVGARRSLQRFVVAAGLGPGSSGLSAYALDRRLRELHYALGRVDGSYGQDDVDAITAFQKLHDLARTGIVDARVWAELARATVPRARYPGDHIEVSKGLQVLFVVRGGEVALVSTVSTGATGNTPLGHFRVYSKVPGYNAKEMFYSSFFIGGFAIHGYHSVPAYPASHGCVRIPLWLAVRVYSLIDYGTSVYIYW
ncbi:MAG TPA: L,D-transpeptidase family protein [Gaiellaceae bacterium]|nr:L,D-transpeptidase family protein [Gaiellaceae bacterium]